MEEVNQGNIDQIIQGNNKVLVDFFTSGCRPCKILAPILEEMEKDFGDVKFVKINAEDNGDYSDQLKVSSVPTLIFFASGQEKVRYEGLMPKTALRDWITEAGK